MTLRENESTKRLTSRKSKPNREMSASISSGEAGVVVARTRLKPRRGSQQPQSSRSIQLKVETHPDSDAAVLGDDGALCDGETQSHYSPIIAEIIQLWRVRQNWVRAETTLKLRGIGLCRSHIARSQNVEYGNKLSKSQLVEAKELFKLHLRGLANENSDLSWALLPIVTALRTMRPSLHLSAKRLKGLGPDRQIDRDIVETRLKEMARSLPVWPWVADIKGFGDGNFAGIIGEAGDIGSYRNPSCLWKRLGLAVIEGQRQRRVADRELAIIMGYSPSRRSVAYLLGTCMIKVGDRCRYRPVYIDRREKFADRAKCKAHSHNDAMRIMVKRVLRDLWIAWRRAAQELRPQRALPAAVFSAQAECPATCGLQPRIDPPGTSFPAKAGRRKARSEVKSKSSLPSVAVI